MNRNTVRLYEKCHSCVELSKGACKGKETSTPCIVYKSKEQYAKDRVTDIKAMIKKVQKEGER